MNQETIQPLKADELDISSFCFLGFFVFFLKCVRVEFSIREAQMIQEIHFPFHQNDIYGCFKVTLSMIETLMRSFVISVPGDL